MALAMFTPRARGRIEPPNLKALQDLSFARHGNVLKALRQITPPAAYDARTAISTLPAYTEAADDQGQCGSCWCFSGVNVVEAALMAAGILTPDQRLSKEYILDCQKTGGCNGDDNTTVLDIAKSNGIPLASDYGPYTAGSGSTGRCKWTASMKLYKIDSWLFLDSNGGQGVTSTDDIKRGIMAYGGEIGCGVAAGSDWDNIGPTSTITGRSSNIDHDVTYVGWDDNHDNGDGTKGAWIMKNNWGTSWGMGGYCWIKYGADSGGTESVAAVVAGPTPPPYPEVLTWSDL